MRTVVLHNNNDASPPRPSRRLDDELGVFPKAIQHPAEVARALDN
jgi:hypothetical protein